MRAESRRKPDWLKAKLPTGNTFFRVKRYLQERGLHTICQSARCPNISECWGNGNATFLILGDICTRNCLFCSVKTGKPEGINKDEAKRIYEVIKILNLKYVVITSVTRDDLSDEGSNHFKNVVEYIKSNNKNIKVELLIPDFNANKNLLENVFTSKPEVIAHNIETVKSLYPYVNRSFDNYKISLNVLKMISDSGFITKSGIMVGLGESIDEILETFDDLLNSGVELLTIGQYLQPTKKNIPVKKYYSPKEFEVLKEKGLKMGFKEIESGPFVRSSYNADKMYYNYIGK